MAKSNSTSKSFYTPTHCPKTGRKFTKEERRAANKAKWIAEQAAKAKKRDASKSKSKTKTKAKSTPAESNQRMKLADIKSWSEANPTRKTISQLDLSDWMTQKKSKTAKALDRKGKIDSGMSKRNNKLEVQAQYKGGTLA
jgi:hypothetical protein